VLAGFRGYRMDEVDAVLNRVAEALTDRGDEIRLLRRRLAAVEQPVGAVAEQAPSGGSAQPVAEHEPGEKPPPEAEPEPVQRRPATA
jgi:cell division septum initiation protein DivIVA